MKSIVLAAGFATRMFPLTQDRAKPLLDVGGRPVLEWLADRILALPEIDELVVVTNDRFHRDFLAWSASYDARIPVRVINDGARDNEERLGALGDFALAVEAIQDTDSPLLLVAGDNLIDFDLAPYAERFRAEPTRPLLLVRDLEEPVPPRRYNEVAFEEDGRVTAFREKPEDHRTPLAALPLYFLPADTRADLAAYLAEEANHDAPGYWIEWLHARRPLQAARCAAVHDIGNLESLERARILFADRAC